MGFDSRTEFYQANYVLTGKVAPQEILDEKLDAFAARLGSVLNGLRESRLAPGIVVFGSMARGRFLPGDVDIALDLKETTATGQELASLLAIGRRHYGYLDPFVVNRAGTMFVRDENSMGWVKAKNAIPDEKATDIRSAIAREGRPLSEIVWSLADEPANYDPVAWEVERFRKRWDEMPGMGWRPDVLAHWERQLRREADAHPYPEVQALLMEFDRKRTDEVGFAPVP